MYRHNDHFGYEIHGQTLGEAWLSLVEAIVNHGEECFDEGRKRLALQSVRLRSETQQTPDTLIHKYGNQENLKKFIALTFSESVMYDFDKTPSFSPGAKSYNQRIKEGKLLDFVIKRLSLIPESKKAVIVFLAREDYDAVLKNPKNDYLPCLVSMQFRLQQRAGGYYVNTTCSFRSLDAFQKAHGNLEAIGMMTKIVADGIANRLFNGKKNIEYGYLDCIIADAHIYANTLDEAKSVVEAYQRGAR